MKNIVMRFFHKGVNSQKRADFIMDLRRPESKVINRWSLSEKIVALAFVEECESKFMDFKNELKKTLQQ